MASPGLNVNHLQLHHKIIMDVLLIRALWAVLVIAYALWRYGSREDNAIGIGCVAVIVLLIGMFAVVS